jgi:hypothetical protein
MCCASSNFLQFSGAHYFHASHATPIFCDGFRGLQKSPFLTSYTFVCTSIRIQLLSSENFFRQHIAHSTL